MGTCVQLGGKATGACGWADGRAGGRAIQGWQASGRVGGQAEQSRAGKVEVEQIAWLPSPSTHLMMRHTMLRGAALLLCGSPVRALPLAARHGALSSEPGRKGTTLEPCCIYSGRPRASHKNSFSASSSPHTLLTTYSATMRLQNRGVCQASGVFITCPCKPCAGMLCPCRWQPLPMPLAAVAYIQNDACKCLRGSMAAARTAASQSSQQQ